MLDLQRIVHLSKFGKPSEPPVADVTMDPDDRLASGIIKTARHIRAEASS
jgi:hypothetical protein